MTPNVSELQRMQEEVAYDMAMIAAEYIIRKTSYTIPQKVQMERKTIIADKLMATWRTRFCQSSSGG